MHHAFGLTGRPGGIQYKKRVFRIHLCCRDQWISCSFHFFYFFLPPYVTPLKHTHRRECSFQHDHSLYKRTAHQRVIYHVLQLYILRAPVCAVASDNKRCLCILQAIRNTLGTEPAEYHRVYRPDTCTCQHGYRQLRHHTHINADPVSLFNTIVDQYIGKLVHFKIQLVIGDHPVFVLRIVWLPDDCRLISGDREMPV